jgi:hypothetical protein
MPPKPMKTPEITSKIQRFFDAEEGLQRFRDRNRVVLAEFETWVNARNDALAEAEAEIRAQQVSLGPFQLLSVHSLVDNAAVVEKIGRDRFLAIGGVFEEVPKISAHKLQVAIGTKQVPADAVHLVRESPRYNVPKRLIIK